MSRRDRSTGQSGRKDGHRANIDWTKVEGLGVEADLIIAQRLGLSESAVGQARRRLKFPAPAMWRTSSPVHAFSHLLGKVPDRIIAERAGVTGHTVVRIRARSGVPPWRPYAWDRPTPLGRRWWRRYCWPHRDFKVVA